MLTLNTTSGPFRKLGRLYESCMRQTLNSTTIRLEIEKLGGYLPISALGPSTVSPLLVKFSEMGAPIPLLDVYYDLSWGKKPEALLIIDVPMHTSSLLEVSLKKFELISILLKFKLLNVLESRSLDDSKSSSF